MPCRGAEWSEPAKAQAAAKARMPDHRCAQALAQLVRRCAGADRAPSTAFAASTGFSHLPVRSTPRLSWHHRAACPRAASSCQGLPRGRSHCCSQFLLRDLNVIAQRHDDRRLEVIANGLPLWGGVQLAVDTTLVSALDASGRPRRHQRRTLGAALRIARLAKERTYPELIRAQRCRLVVLANEVAGCWSSEAVEFVRLLARYAAESKRISGLVGRAVKTRPANGPPWDCSMAREAASLAWAISAASWSSRTLDAARCQPRPKSAGSSCESSSGGSGAARRSAQGGASKPWWARTAAGP